MLILPTKPPAATAGTIQLDSNAASWQQETKGRQGVEAKAATIDSVCFARFGGHVCLVSKYPPKELAWSASRGGRSWMRYLRYCMFSSLNQDAKDLRRKCVIHHVFALERKQLQSWLTWWTTAFIRLPSPGAHCRASELWCRATA